MIADLLPLAFILVVPIFVIEGLFTGFRGLQAGWKGYLLWESVPVLLTILLFIIIACVNWSYEGKLVIPRADASLSFTDANLGPLLLILAIGCAVCASGFLYALRLIGLWLSRPNGGWYLWFPAVLLGFIASLLSVAAVSIIQLGPAAMTMREQMTRDPGP